MNDQFLYFAYGSNMCTGRLRDRVPSASFVRIGYVAQRSLRFHKRSTTDGSGKCDAFRTANPNDELWGVMFLINMNEKSDLDEAEGLGRGYDEENLSVQSDRGMVQALAYVAAPRSIVPTLQPYSWYRDFVLAGAQEHQLSAAYIEAIQAVQTSEDPDQARAARERRLLPPWYRAP